MRRIISLFLVVVLLLTACAKPAVQTSTDESTTSVSITDDQTTGDKTEVDWQDAKPDFAEMNDENLLLYVQNAVYKAAIQELDSNEYVVEEVRAVYVSQEYLDEVAFNSQSNVYFGNTLAELDELFQGKRYVFTLGEDGQTTVQELQTVTDTATETMIKNVATGAGVILICVTVSAVSGGIGAPAISTIFAASAKSATIMAVSSTIFGGISSGILKAFQTNNVNEALKSAAVGASEGFKWGAIIGAFSGGYNEALYLQSGTKSGLTMNQVAQIQQESQYPMDVISQISNMKEYNVYHSSGLQHQILSNGQSVLVPKTFDLNHVSQLPDGTSVTNLVRMEKGYAAIEATTGKPYHLHHIGQKSDGTLAVLTEEMHQVNSSILHKPGISSEINRPMFDIARKGIWQQISDLVQEQVVVPQ